MTDDWFNDEERRRWEEEGWKRQRGKYAATLKGQAAGITTKRIATYEWALKVADEIDTACVELGVSLGKMPDQAALASQLSKQGVVSQQGVPVHQLAEKGRKFVDVVISKTIPPLIDEAVLECRTLMTARCLSADFTKSTLDELEAEYIDIIADLLALEDRLNHRRPRERSALLSRAKDAAATVARGQRRDKPAVTMAARERYWRDRPAPFRKIFEYRQS